MDHPPTHQPTTNHRPTTNQPTTHQLPNLHGGSWRSTTMNQSWWWWCTAKLIVPPYLGCLRAGSFRRCWSTRHRSTGHRVAPHPPEPERQTPQHRLVRSGWNKNWVVNKWLCWLLPVTVSMYMDISCNVQTMCAFKYSHMHLCPGSSSRINGCSWAQRLSRHRYQWIR